jgi:hypothetical protein
MWKLDNSFTGHTKCKGDESEEELERNKLAKGMDQFMGDPSGGSHKRCVVQSNP